jgi:hypothetical protein
MQCDHKSMMRRMRLDFVSKNATRGDDRPAIHFPTLRETGAWLIFEPELFRPTVIVDSYCFHVFHFAHLLGKFKVRVTVSSLPLALRWYWLNRNLFSSFWNEWFEQQFERRTQPQLFTFMLKQSLRIGRGFQRVPEVRQPHEPDGVAEVFFSAHLKCDPAGIRNPVVLFS